MKKNLGEKNLIGDSETYFWVIFYRSDENWVAAGEAVQRIFFRLLGNFSAPKFFFCSTSLPLASK